MFKIKNHFREWYRPHSSFVVRNPLLPVSDFFKWTTGAINSKQDLRRSLREFFLQPIVQEALYIASPGMHERLLLWLEDKIDNTDKKEKTEQSLIKYMIRMCSRCTPYGLFATCTSGVMGDETNIQLSEPGNVERFGRLDMDFLCELHKHLLKQKEISEQLLFFPNNSLYPVGEHWRYIEHRFTKAKGRSYHLVEMDHSSHLGKILSAAASGQKPAVLAATITDHKISSEDAIDFIYELINSQVLVDELHPAVTGEDYFSVLLRKLKALHHTDKYVENFEEIAGLFKKIMVTDGSVKDQFYRKVIHELPQLDDEFESKSLIQVDSYRPASVCTLNKKVNDEILKGINLLQLLADKETIADPFTAFKTSFRKRYNDEWIPLVEVLDTEWGIGYGRFATNGMEESPLINNLPVGNSANDSTKLRDTESFKWKLYEEAIAKGVTEIQIDDNVIEQLVKKEVNTAVLPDSFNAMVKINAASSKDIDNGNYKLCFQSISGPSGGNLLGRFCHLDPGIENLTRDILGEEEAHHPDFVFAEIVHLPESRIGNILMRPVLRKYEIPYLCNSALDKEFQISVTDLLVGIESDKVMLRSRQLNKQVIPRMTAAHNFNMTSLPIYQFLCDMQNQGVHLAEWQWGILGDRPFLPRVSYGRFILSKARWILTKDEIKDCDKKNDEDLLSAFTEIKKLRRLPDHIVLEEGDNELMLHLENIYCIMLLLSEVNKKGSVILTELMDTPDQCWIKNQNGSHAGEFIVAFSRKKTVSVISSPANIPAKQNINIKRVFPVGSEWLYAKIFCGTKTAEKLLSSTLKQFSKEVSSEHLIDKFFFLRYHDEGHHIRIRFHNRVKKLFWTEVISRLQKSLQPFIDDRTIYNVQFETYQRELERYGYDTMEMSEDLFWHHSVAVMNFIALLDGDEGERYRWLMGIKAIDLLLNDFGYTPEQKHKLISSLNRSFSEEFKIGHTERKKISDRFSDHKQLLDTLMSEGWKEDEELAKAIHIFTFRTRSYRKTVEGILKASSVQGNRIQLDYLMRSYLHMFINRLFVSSQRKTEMVIYEYLFRYLDSKIAREKMKTTVLSSIVRD